MIAGCRENLRDAILRIYSEAHKIDKRRAHEEDEISQAHSLPGDPDRARHGPPACAAGRREPRPLDLLHTLHHLWPGVRPDHLRFRWVLTAEPARPRPRSRGRFGEILLDPLRLVPPEPPRLVVPQRRGAVERAGVDPDAPGPHRPGALDGGGEQGAADPPAQEAGEKAEIDQLDLVAGLALQLEVAGGRPFQTADPGL